MSRYRRCMTTLLVAHLLVLGSTSAHAADLPAADASATIDALFTQARAAETRGDAKGAAKTWG